MEVLWRKCGIIYSKSLMNSKAFWKGNSVEVWNILKKVIAQWIECKSTDVANMSSKVSGLKKICDDESYEKLVRPEIKKIEQNCNVLHLNQLSQFHYI